MNAPARPVQPAQETRQLPLGPMERWRRFGDVIRRTAALSFQASSCDEATHIVLLHLRSNLVELFYFGQSGFEIAPYSASNCLIAELNISARSFA
jgi:hypothetical protein